MKGASKGLEGGLRRASRGLQGGLRRASRGLEKGFKGASSPSHLRAPPPVIYFCFTCLHNAFMHVDMYT